MKAGGFVFRNTATGRTQGMPVTYTGPDEVKEPDGYAPYYPREGDYVTLAPGEELASEYKVDAAERKHLGKLAAAGHAWEITFQYASMRSWFVRPDGHIGRRYDAWTGRLAAPAIRIAPPAP